MEWRDEGVLLVTRPHGEHALIIEVLTPGHGRHAGVVPGGASRRMAPMLQPGSDLALVWRARLDDHLGTFTAEPLRARSGLMSDRLALAGLSSACAVLHLALPERDPHPALHAATVTLFDAMEALPDWPALYLRWELGLLDEIGFGLDLSACAVTGATEGLAFVSPRTGCAVTAAAAGQWSDRLLPLPPGLASGRIAAADLPAALALTGHFLARALARDASKPPLPEARSRLVTLLTRLAAEKPD